jgi:hypothetical protein
MSAAAAPLCAAADALPAGTSGAAVPRPITMPIPVPGSPRLRPRFSPRIHPLLPFAIPCDKPLTAMSPARFQAASVHPPFCRRRRLLSVDHRHGPGGSRSRRTFRPEPQPWRRRPPSLHPGQSPHSGHSPRLLAPRQAPVDDDGESVVPAPPPCVLAWNRTLPPAAPVVGSGIAANGRPRGIFGVLTFLRVRCIFPESTT